MVVRLALAAGLLFELPLATYFLARVGIITSDWMRKHRKHAAVVLLIVSAIITPPDWITQVLIFIPLAGLYEVSIWVAKRVEKNDEKDRLADQETEAQRQRRRDQQCDTCPVILQVEAQNVLEVSQAVVATKAHVVAEERQHQREGHGLGDDR